MDWVLEIFFVRGIKEENKILKIFVKYGILCVKRRFI